MSDSNDPATQPSPVQTTPLAANPPPAPPRRSCGSRIFGFLGWLLTLVLSVGLALAAAAAILYFVFGLNLTTPQQIREANTNVAALQNEIARLSTAEATQAGALSDAREQISALEDRANNLDTQAAQLGQEVAIAATQAAELAEEAATAAALSGELNEAIALAATLQAENREDQVVIAVFATVQAENSTRLGSLQERTDRIVRFLQRLSDLSGDLGGSLETPTAGSATPTPFDETITPTTSVSPTQTPTATPGS